LYAKDYRAEYQQTYEATLCKVFEKSEQSINDVIDGNISDEKKARIIRIICDAFTEVWVKEVAIDERNNPHLGEI
jgi:hypothetical protein